MGRRSGRRSPAVDDVLAGRERLDAVDLMRLIHRVNPTGDELSSAEEARRYRQKAALQSILLRHHGASVVVEPSGDGVVSLRHAHFDLDACHAVEGELDEDARSLVRWRLDAGLEEAPVVTAPRERAAVGDGDLSAQGRKALEEYDYEEARSCFEGAWRRAGGAATTRDLVEFLVDHVADYGPVASPCD